jgi:hypothetical protein
MAAINDLSFYKGEAITQPLHHVLEGTTTDVDITGWTIQLNVKPNPNKSANPVFTKTLPTTSPSTGRYSLALTHTESAQLRAGGYYYDIQRTDSGSEAVMSIGRWIVQQEIKYA